MTIEPAIFFKCMFLLSTIRVSKSAISSKVMINLLFFLLFDTKINEVPYPTEYRESIMPGLTGDSNPMWLYMLQYNKVSCRF